MANFSEDMDGLSACECPVCFNFISETLPPMSMPCGHTLCSGCIDSLVSKATVNTSGRVSAPTFRCPLCRDWVSRASVRPNVTLRDLIAQLASMGVKLTGPEMHKARILSALHVNYADIEVGPSLDRGAFGEVFRGVWRGNDIALKMFSSGIMTPEAMQAFQREVFVMNCLRHPNVVLLMGACQTPPKLAIIMEYVAGGSLHKLIHVDKIQLTLKEASSLGGDVCCGLQYLHSINILHRDLKSKNVLLSGSLSGGQAKLCDFGLARMRLESATLTGNVGTVHWTAPEVLTNARYKFSADVYSLGMVLFEMACGHIPFRSMVPLAVMMAVAINKLKPDIPATVEPRMTKIILDCISWEPDDRPPVAGVLMALRDLVNSAPGNPNTTTTQEKRSQLTHSDSLGVVFLSVTDSTDLGEQDEKLVGVVKKFGLSTPTVAQRSVSEDRLLAWKLMDEERQTMVSRDEDLAHQLQLRENAYLSPSNTTVKAFPPKSVLDSITSLKKKGSGPDETSNVVMADSPTKSVKSKKMTPSKSLLKKTKTASSTEHNSPSVKMKQLKKMTDSFKSKLTRSSPPSTPPAPPPPPPLVHTKQLNHQQVYKLSGAGNAMSHRRKLLNQVRSSGKKVAQKLRPVETVEKRAFRVGHVVGGYSSERSQFTVQNQIRFFSRRLLHNVPLNEPPPAFPVGKVLEPARGAKVKRLSSMIESQNGGKVKALRPNVKAQIVSFPSRSLHHVIPEVKQSLPTAEDMLMQDEQTLPVSLRKLHPHIQSEIVAFPTDRLRCVDTKVKQRLPTQEDILQEKSILTADGKSGRSNSETISEQLEFEGDSCNHNS